MEIALSKLESGRFAALLYLFLCGGNVFEKDLDTNNDEIDKTILDEVFDTDLVKGKSKDQLSHKKKIKILLESLDHLSSSLVTKNKLWREQDAVYYRFSHGSVKDIVALLYAKNEPIGFIENCPCNSLYYITTSKDTTNKRVIISDAKHMYLLYKRLLRELGSKCPKHYSIIASLDVWNDDKFAQGFFRWLDDEETDQDFHMNWTTENVNIHCLCDWNSKSNEFHDKNCRVSFLVYVAYSDNYCLLTKFVERTPNNHPQLQYALYSMILAEKFSPCIFQETLALLYGKIKRSVFLQNCPIDCLPYVTTSKNVINKILAEHDDVDMYKRLLKEIQSKKSEIYIFIARLDIWKDNLFALGFLKWLENEGIDKDFHLNWTTKDTTAFRYGYGYNGVHIQSPSFLVYVAHTDNLFLLEKLVERTPEGHVELQRALFTIIKSDPFSSNSVRKRIAFLYRRVTQRVFIQNCPSDLLPYITTSKNMTRKLVIDPCYLDMYKRLMKELENKLHENYKYIAALDIWEENQFVQGFFRWLDNEGIAKDFHLTWTVEDIERYRGIMPNKAYMHGGDKDIIQPPSFLFYVANTNNLFLVEKLVKRTPEDHPQLQFALLSVITSGHFNVQSYTSDRVKAKFLFQKITPIWFIQNCPCNYLHFITTARNKSYRKVIAPDNIDMYKRLLRELETKRPKNYRYVAALDIWKDNEFVLGFLRWLGNAKLNAAFHINLTTEDVERYMLYRDNDHVSGGVLIQSPSFLVYVAHTDNLFLLEKLVEKTPVHHVQLKRALVSINGSGQHFQDSVLDRIQILFCKMSKTDFIKNCPRDCLHYITSEKIIKTLVVAHDDVDMYKRFLRELQGKSSEIYKYIARLDIWNDNQFVLGFLGWLENEGIDRDFHLNWTTEDVERYNQVSDSKGLYDTNRVHIQSPSFLVYVAHTGNLFLLEKLVERTPEDHPQLKSALFTVITGPYFKKNYSPHQIRAELLFGKITPTCFIQNCPCCSLDFITTSKNIRYKKAIAPDNVTCMYKRLLRELESKRSENYRYIANLDIWKDNEFVLGFLSWLDDERTVKTFHLQWTTEDVERYQLYSDKDNSSDRVLIQSPSFLVYVAHAENLIFLDELVGRTPENNVQLQCALFAVIGRGPSDYEPFRAFQDRISLLLRKITKCVFIPNCLRDCWHDISTSIKVINTLVVKYGNVDLYKCFLRELESKRSEVYKCIAALDIWKDNKYVLGFLGWLEIEGIDRDFHLNWTAEDVERYNQVSDSKGLYDTNRVHIQSPSFLVYVAHAGNLFLLEKLVERTPEDHPQLQSALFTVITSPYFNVQSSSDDRDRADYLLRRITPICFIQNCSCCSLDFITTSKIIKYKKAIAPDNVDMYKRLLRELESKRPENYSYIAELDIWKDSEFVLGYIRWIEGIHKDFHLKWTTDVQMNSSYHFCMEGEDPFIRREYSLSFLVYVAHSDNLSFLNKLLGRTPKDHEQLQFVMFGVIRAGHIGVLNNLIDWGTPPKCLAMSSGKLTEDDFYDDTLHRINVLVEACLYERKEMVERLATSFPFLVHDISEFVGYILYIAAKTGNCSLYKTVEAILFPGLSREERAHRLREMANGHKFGWTVLLCSAYEFDRNESMNSYPLLNSPELAFARDNKGRHCHTTLYKLDSNESLTLYLLSNYPELASARDNEGWHCLHHMSKTSSRDLFIKAHSHFRNYYKDFNITTIVTNKGESVLDVASDPENFNLYGEEICEYLSQFWAQTSDTPDPEFD